jgi:hypothetical protein
VFDNDAPFESLLQVFVQRLCETCAPESFPLLIVDGLDEAAESEAHILEERVFSNFLNRDCTRVLLAYRDEYWLKNHHLRRDVQIERLAVFETGEGYSQLEKQVRALDSIEGSALLDLDKFVHCLRFYHWDHPYINFVLFDVALRHGRTRLTKSDLQNCLYMILQPIELELPVFDLLSKLAHIKQMADSWTMKHLRDELGIGVDDNGFDQLFKAGVVYHIRGTPRYQVADGIRELLRDHQALTS